MYDICSGVAMSAGVRYASFDGDADRIVYYYVDTGMIHIDTALSHIDTCVSHIDTCESRCYRCESH